MKYVAVGILIRDGTVLACQRSRSAVYPLKWEFPGGKIEPGESAPQALVRELREELGIEAKIGEEFYRQEWTYPEGVDDPGRDGTFRVLYYTVRSFSGEPTNRVFEQVRWVAPADLLRMDILEGNRSALELLVKQTDGSPSAAHPA